MKKLTITILLAFAMLLSACGGGAATTESQTPEAAFTGDYIVDATYVKERIGDENVILLDARGEDNAKKGTIEGAITTTWQYLSNVEIPQGEYEWGLILEPEELSRRLGELGLTKEKEIILFADGPNGWGEDGRLLWTLRAAGYPNLKMVDGGRAALESAGLSKTNAPKAPTPVTVTIDPLDYKHVINTKELESSYDSYKIVDVRAKAEYDGATKYGEQKGGHLPGAILLQYSDLFKPDGTLKSNADIEKMVEDAGLKKDDKIVTYCTAGIRSAYTQLVLEMLGYQSSQNYDGSYYTWCATNPVE